MVVNLQTVQSELGSGIEIRATMKRKLSKKRFRAGLIVGILLLSIIESKGKTFGLRKYMG